MAFSDRIVINKLTILDCPDHLRVAGNQTRTHCSMTAAKRAHQEMAAW
jgi:hypothetical protein